MTRTEKVLKAMGAFDTKFKITERLLKMLNH